MGTPAHAIPHGEPRRARLDGALPLAALITVPWLVSREFVLAVPLIFLVLAGAVSATAALRPGEPAAAWRAYSVAAGAALVAALLVISGVSLDAATGLGGAGSLALLVGLALHLRSRLHYARFQRVLDSAQLILLPAAAAVYFVVIPAFGDGHVVPALVVSADIVAYSVAGMLAACWRRVQDRNVALRLWAVTGLVLLADAASSGVVDGIPAAHVRAALYAVAGWFLAAAALSERPSR